MKRAKANTFIALSDFWMALNSVIFLLFVYAVLSMAIQNPPKAGIQLKAEYIITAEWDLDHDCDVDLWVRDPLGNIIYFNAKDAGSLHLDHDSRGSLSDEQKLPDGTYVHPRAYIETATLRGIVPGEYAVNLHLYGVGANHKVGDPYEVPVKVTITRINPVATEEFGKTVTLEFIWQELTVIRFTLSATGEWLGTDKTPMILLGNRQP